MAMVLGANVGGVPSVLSAGSAVARLPVGNLLIRLLGTIDAVVTAWLPLLANHLAQTNLGPAHLVVYLHTAFNLALAVLCIGLIEPMANGLSRLFHNKNVRQTRACRNAWTKPG